MRYIKTFSSDGSDNDAEINSFLEAKQAKLISVCKFYFEDHYDDGRVCNSWFDITIIYEV